HAIEDWYDAPEFIQYWATSIREELARVKEADKAIVLFSAHSLPEKILQVGDPYAEQLEISASKIAKKANIDHYTLAWQSAGKTNQKWLGPDVCDVTKDLYAEGYREFIY